MVHNSNSLQKYRIRKLKIVQYSVYFQLETIVLSMECYNQRNQQYFETTLIFKGWYS